MTDLYVANCTKQAHEFNYRLPEGMKIITRRIESGEQIKINGMDATLDSIINQHTMYGLRSAKELKSGVPFSGLIYQLNKPLDVAAISTGINYRDDAMNAEGLEARKAAAVSIDASLKDIARNGGAKLNSFEVEVIEQPKGPSDHGPHFNQKIAVQEEDTKPSGGQRRKRA